MKKWLVWREEGSIDDALTVDAFDAEDAATTACENWHDHGAWAGDEIPDEILCCVSEIGDLSRSEHAVVSVTHDYSIEWHGYTK